ncbi:FAD-dependent oxidoreductase [Herbiconiux moechotypicola]|uniref:FAD-binding oxidoreductase n=1 Tax=Herbiconiux moechotypicola TaxID=637393 RepID=A0ABN3DW14_9MICO|nr:FAD-dependent oxidoreductase [Herbiconiux moechotypicola]MCS5730942.1 FAD-dependent oxidoreductase [Herbiconiux moechotypicola]
MARQIDTLVVGGGSTGTAAAWRLAARGVEVAVLERRPEHPAHRAGESLDAALAPEGSFVSTAHSDTVLLPLVADSVRLWRELEEQVGSVVLRRVGGLRHGDDPALDEVAVVAPRFGIDAERVDPAGTRWPRVRLDTAAVWSPATSAVGVEHATARLRVAARQNAAEFRFGTAVTRIRVLGDDRALVEAVPVDEGGARVGLAEEWECRRLVVSLGAWTTKLIGPLVVLPRLTVSRVETATLVASDGSPEPIPVLEHRRSPRDPRFGHWLAPRLVAVPVPGGVEISWLGDGPAAGRAVRDPDARPARPPRQAASALARYTREWLPSLQPSETTPLRSSLHTVARDGRFVIDRVGPVSVAVGFSDHGLTFAPAVGELLADLAEGIRAPAPFSLRPGLRAGAAASGSPVASGAPAASAPVASAPSPSPSRS